MKQSLSPNAVFLPVDQYRDRRLFEDFTLALLDISPRLEMEYQVTSAVWYSDDLTMLPLTLEIRLSAIQDCKPVQLSLFAEKKPIQSLHDYLPEWASRRRGANFYHLESHFEPVLEERLEKRKIEGL